MKKLVFLLLFTALFASAQRKEIDSLLKVLKKYDALSASIERDTLRVKPIQYLMYYYTFTNPDSAFYYTQILLDISKQQNLTKNIAYCYNYFGYLYNQQGNYFLGANNYYQALIIAEKNNDKTQILNAKRLLTESYIGLEDYEKATKYAQESLSLALLLKNKNEEMSSLNNLGLIYMKEGKLADAKKCFELNYQRASKFDDKDFTSLSINALGLVAFEQKDYDKAIQLFNQQIKFYSSNSIDYARVQVDMAKVLIAKKQFDNAIEKLIYAQNIFEKEGGEDRLPIVYELLYKSYKSIGKTTNALVFHEKFMNIKDSLSQESNQKRIRSLQLEYDNSQQKSQLQQKNIELLEEKTQTQALTQTRNLFIGGGLLAILIAGILFWNNNKLNTKNKQIELQKSQILLSQEQLENANQTLEFRVNERTQALALANDELTRKNEEIKTALFTGQSIERKRVANELHDNLSSLLSAIKMSLQAIKTDNLSDSEKKIYSNIKELTGNAYSEVRNISHNIMPEGLERDGLYKTVEKLVEKLNQNQRLEFKLMPQNMSKRPPIAIELNVYSIILELLNNIIKHAEATQASIEMTKLADKFIVKISDNGKGFDIAKSNDGKGLSNIKTRLDAMNGEIFYQSEANKMTSFEINIPLI